MLIIVSCAGAIFASFAAAQSTGGLPSANYIPHLGDIMGAMQLRHFKLSFAGKLRNWELAAYELDQIKESFHDAATLYPGIPVADMTIMAEPVRRLGEAIQKKEPKKFAAAFSELTAACNGCHQAIGRGFIVIKVPTSSPFSNQVFEPAARP
ncbi:hypothetical protein NB311A_11162 [Nitrobacter sp. Nb-311A]|uniref:hypothetical protein n=2 Tax=Nitrobacter TaxID=911 RepID=UPI00006865F1|nr:MULTISPECIES: hypothetical protein [unclassified Nitrobacter]EAQ35996.1 hypothetical protein NB311A_11162 [Nitrobacter sp. Nb-311A]